MGDFMGKFVTFCKNNTSFLTKEAVQQYKGICAIVIMLYHLGWSLDFQYYRPFSHGDYVTGLFYFFSGYGLFKKFNEDRTYHIGFIRKRVFPIAFMFLLMCTVYWLFYYLEGFCYTPLGIIKDFCLYGNSFVKYSWFIISIIYFYIVFYLLMRLFKQNHVAIVIGTFVLTIFYVAMVLALGWGMHWYTTSIFFFLGLLFVYREEKWMKYLLKYFCLCFGFLLCCLLFSNYARTDLFLAGKKHILFTILANFSFVFLFILCSLKIRIRIPFLAKIGNLSLEIYLVHGLVILIMNKIGIRDYLVLAYAFVVFITLILAIVLSKIRSIFFNKKKDSYLKVK
ncbi:MAG: acyltransferase family protein [Lachnospiraceae bacterium]|nr:acyltransferase family protein [Lachnospiraceae bacterium]